MRTVKFDNMDSYADFGLIRSSATIGTPAPKTSKVDIEGADGSLDLTEYFGEVFYDNRELSFDFQVPPQDDNNFYATSEMKSDGNGGFIILGKTRQNLWQNPNFTSNGVTVKANSDGSVTLSGTKNTSTAWAGGYVECYALEPGKTYTLTVSKSVDDQAGFYIQPIIDGSAGTATYIGRTGGDNSATFTVQEGTQYYRFGFGVDSAGTPTLSGTYYIMLNEGSKAEQWCKPGISGTEELKIYGSKNIIELGAYSSTNGIVKYASEAGYACIHYTGAIAWDVLGYVDLEAGKEYVISADTMKWCRIGLANKINSPDSYPAAIAIKDTGRTCGRLLGSDILSTRFEAYTDQRAYIMVCSDIQENKNPEFTVKLQVEQGGDATEWVRAYKPVTVDLGGNVLYSLPETTDKLRMSVNGDIVLESNIVFKSVLETDWVKFEGSETFLNGDVYYCTLSDASVKEVCGNIISDQYFTTNDATVNQPMNGIRTAYAGDRLYVIVATGTKPVACNAIYSIATKKITDLGYIDMQAFSQSFHDVFSRLKNAIHGKRCKITLSDDPGYYYVGRCEVDEWKTNELIGQITVDVDAEPYKYRQGATVRNFTVSGSLTATFTNLRKRVVPTFELSAAMTIKNGGQSFSGTKGTYSDTGLYFDQGETQLTFEGNGTVKVTYQERGL